MNKAKVATILRKISGVTHFENLKSVRRQTDQRMKQQQDVLKKQVEKIQSHLQAPGVVIANPNSRKVTTCEEDPMVDAVNPKTNSKVDNPAAHFERPTDVVRDKTLSAGEKKKALNTWEQDARQLLTASNEGMPGSQEGLQPDDHNRLGEVARAKSTMGEKPEK